MKEAEQAAQRLNNLLRELASDMFEEGDEAEEVYYVLEEAMDAAKAWLGSTVGEADAEDRQARLDYKAEMDRETI
tara:strand:- start:2563 stop:2787 length:225 start_codon:yes stop_codon:yes gene_type:complete